MRFFRSNLFIVALLLALLPTGCGESTKTASPGDPGESVDLRYQEGGYTLAVFAIAGINHDQIARQQANAYRESTGLESFWHATEPLQSYVYFGRYDSPDGKAIQADQTRLNRLMSAGLFRPHMMTVKALDPVGVPGGPAGGALATEQPAGLRSTGTVRATGPAKANDLRTAHPDAVFTLQVSVYDDQYKGNHRTAAEQEAAQLRSRNIEAYFYHGPNDSLVTVHAFGEGAYKQVTEPNGTIRNELHPYIQQLRAEKDLTWLRRNGKVFQVTNDRTGAKERVETGLVRIPGR